MSKDKLFRAFGSIDWKNVATRAVWTFVQVFLAAVLLSGELLIDALFTGDYNGLVTLVVAASLSGIAAGLSAVKTIVVEVVVQLRENIK